ncbi:MAG: NUDIX hydrolase [bacterium]
MERWKLINKKEVFSAEPWINVSVQKVKLPGGKVVDDYYQIKLLDYAVIVAYTAEGQMVITRQYRQGIGEVSLLLPGGAIEKGEEPLLAAKRELFEETGYESNSWESLGCFVGSANYGCGKAHLFIAKDIVKVKETIGENELEEMEIVLMEPSKALSAVFSGQVVAMGAVMAISLAINHQHDKK